MNKIKVAIFSVVIATMGFTSCTNSKTVSLSDADKAAKTFDEFQKEGLSASYWFRNNFHYHRQWGHLKEMSSIYNLPVMKMKDAPDYRKLEVPQSDEIMQKLMMTQIMVTWNEEELNLLTTKMRSALKNALK